MLKPHGYKSYVGDQLNVNWVYVVTPDQNLLTVSFDTYGGFTVTFDYQPRIGNGTGRVCKHHDLEPYPPEITLETITQCEQYGLAYANKLGAHRYQTPYINFIFQELNTLALYFAK